MAHSARHIRLTLRPARQGGYSLVEIIVVVIILGILATVAVRSLRSSDDTARLARTRAAMDRIAHAITGNPQLFSGGSRTDFGYVGDIGALPTSLNGLLANPGGYTTWNGPYLSEQFLISGVGTATLKDAWGTAYSYSGGITFQSTGGGSTISRDLAGSVDHLFNNRLDLTVLDLDDHPPGAIYGDSVRVNLTVPNGAGSTTVRTTTVAKDGSAQIASLPVGVHRLQVIYLPTADSLTRLVTIEPGQDSHLQVSFPADLW